MQKVMQGVATPEEKRRFGELWQERVKKMLLEVPAEELVICS
jgi:hypothetical protein